jgi:hypothetical protein
VRAAPTSLLLREVAVCYRSAQKPGWYAFTAYRAVSTRRDPLRQLRLRLRFRYALQQLMSPARESSRGLSAPCWGAASGGSKRLAGRAFWGRERAAGTVPPVGAGVARDRPLRKERPGIAHDSAFERA